MINLQKGREKTLLEFVLFDDILLCPVLWNTTLHMRPCVLLRACVLDLDLFVFGPQIIILREALQLVLTNSNNLKERSCVEKSALPP